MIKCKIGIASRPRKNVQDCFLLLGEIYDNNIRTDIKALYHIHKRLAYMIEFKAIVKKFKVKTNINEDIHQMQTECKLVKTCFFTKRMKDGEHAMLTPELYDLTCMVPLFNDKISLPIVHKNQSIDKILLVLYPTSNPFVRGELVNECLKKINKEEPLFFIFGKETDGYMKYLMKIGIKVDNILVQECDEDIENDFLDEILNMIEFCYLDQVLWRVYLASPREIIKEVLHEVRNISDVKKDKFILRILCN